MFKMSANKIDNDIIKNTPDEDFIFIAGNFKEIVLPLLKQIVVRLDKLDARITELEKK